MNPAESLMVKVRELLPTVDGWCTPDKAQHLVDAILLRQPITCIEIGVFGGSSLLPQAMALEENKHGKIFGIDPWATDAALEEMFSEENRQWWGKLNLEEIYADCSQHVKRLGLSSYVELLRDKAENVVDRFKDNSVGLLHIDGNHSEALSYKDVTLYLPKVKPDGIIFFDDIWWNDGTPEATTRRAIMYLLDRCTRLELVGDCMILRKN